MLQLAAGGMLLLGSLQAVVVGGVAVVAFCPASGSRPLRDRNPAGDGNPSRAFPPLEGRESLEGWESLEGSFDWLPSRPLRESIEGPPSFKRREPLDRQESLEETPSLESVPLINQ